MNQGTFMSGTNSQEGNVPADGVQYLAGQLHPCLSFLKCLPDFSPDRKGMGANVAWMPSNDVQGGFSVPGRQPVK